MFTRINICLLSTMLLLTGLSFQPVTKVHAFSSQVIQHGATGEDVIELQARLQYLGFYNKKIDGVFGWSTYWALRNFQYEFGMEIDGLAGQTAKDKLVKASKYDRAFIKKNIESGHDFTYYGGTPKEYQVKKKKQAPSQQPKPNNGQNTEEKKQAQNQESQQEKKQAQNQEPQQQQNKESQQQKQQGKDMSLEPTSVNVPNGYSQNDIQLMANAVYGEARGEPYEGQVAVAAVILNRVQSTTFPNTVSGVIFEPRAFTAVADGQIWLTPNEKAKKAVVDAINGWDPTGDAIYYFNPNTATSSWIWGRPQIKRIGKHVFCM
ncbi:spore cortex-lytic enzyme [Paraliobacillus ryukyuensis]|uniref:Spore cortex-lytic enzyme n=2 Tax=Paraliobacillus ryukyuensis TaxID=200904 RepID=A0A366EJB5_9BACI|nr:N-acetylmuramoyl-L-alanine amidase [Paraliobacillus ryukyuensis]